MINELEELKKLDCISENINKELDRKNQQFIELINKRKNKELIELNSIKEKIQNPITKKIYLRDSRRIDNRLEQLKCGISVSRAILDLKRINKDLDQEIELYKKELTEFTDEFKKRCSKNYNLKDDVDILVNFIEQLF